jgi:WD40 repeat protein
MALSPDTKTVMADTYGTTVRAWDLATGKELPSLGEHESKVAPKRTMFAFSPDGKTVLTSEINDTFIQVWDWPAAKLRRKINYRTGGIRTMEIDAEGKQANILFVGQNALRSFDLETGKELPPVLAAAHRAPVHGLAVAPDGKVVSAALDNSIRVWDLRTGKQLHEHGVDLINGSSSLALSGDGVLVAVVNTKISRGTVALHERETGRMVRTIETGPLVDLVSHLAFAPEGRLLAVSGVETGPRGRGDRRPFLALWDAESGRELRRLPGAGRDKLCFNPDGRLLAVLSGGQVRLWEVATGRERPALPLSGLSAHAFSPDGRTLALAYRKGIILWELAAGKERGRIEAPLQRARSLAFSPDGRWLACDSDRAVVLCDVWSGQIIHTFNGHASEVPGLAFAPDGRSLVSSSIDTTLLV